MRVKDCLKVSVAYNEGKLFSRITKKAEKIMLNSAVLLSVKLNDPKGG